MKYLVGIPCMDSVHTDFFRSVIGMARLPDTRFTLTMSSLIYDARNSIAKQAMLENYDRILWLDSDMSFDWDLMQKLAADMDEGREFVCGLYFKRKPPIAPVVYKKIGHLELENGGVKPFAVPFEDYPRDQIFPIEGAGFGACMVSVPLIKRVVDKFGLPFSPILGFGEDLSFCARAKEVGAELWCDSRIKLGHIGSAVFNEELYLSTLEAKNDGNAGHSQVGNEADKE